MHRQTMGRPAGARVVPLTLTLGLALTLAACDTAGTGPVGPEPEPPAPTPVGAWTAAVVDGHEVPSTAYLFDPDEAYGYPASVHFVVDSVSLVLHADGSWVQRLWASEWEGNVGGPAHTLRHRWFVGDHGTWNRSGDALLLASGFLQNRTLSGFFVPPSEIILDHGLGHGDPPVRFRYRREAGE